MYGAPCLHIARAFPEHARPQAKAPPNLFLYLLTSVS